MTSSAELQRQKGPSLWICTTLRAGYIHWSWSAGFFDRLSLLQSICPEEKEEEETYFEKLGNTLRGKSYEQLIALLKDHP
jgi:hypothetical protein